MDQDQFGGKLYFLFPQVRPSLFWLVRQASDSSECHSSLQMGAARLQTVCWPSDSFKFLQAGHSYVGSTIFVQLYVKQILHNISLPT